MENDAGGTNSNRDYIEQYKSYLTDVGNIGIRHENARRFYLSVVSALFVFLSLAGSTGVFQMIRGPVLTLVGIAGVALCLVWLMHMLSFGAIYRAKFDVLRSIEEKHHLFHIFDEEWKHLQANPRFKLLTIIDSVTPILFAILFMAILYFKRLG
jgi:hypothetical protein